MESESNPHLADALGKVLKMTNKKGHKSIVLSRAKLFTDKKEVTIDCGFQVDSSKPVNNEDDEDIKPELEDLKPDKKELKKCRRVNRQDKLRRGRLKASVLDREKEKPLVKIATKGVVQLFNAVRQQQLIINKKIEEQGTTETKREKIFKSIDKEAFLEVLKGPTTKMENSNLPDLKELNGEADVKKEDNTQEPTWDVLRDDFMMGAKLKDWDKKEDDNIDIVKTKRSRNK